MTVRFDPAARRAIDRAMIEVERRGHATLETAHLLLGLTEASDAPASVVLASLGVDTRALRESADRTLATLPREEVASVSVDITLDRVLGRASERSREAKHDAVTDVDVLGACLEVPGASAGRILRECGVDPERLDELAAGLIVARVTPPDNEPITAVADYLSRAEAWTQPQPPAETTITSDGDRRSYPGLMPMIEPTPGLAITRVGNGFDSHRFGPGRPLILGGVAIPSDLGLVGHSDGDAIAHAVTDAILGACGAGDIGEMFADTDPANRGRDSIEMLRAAVTRVHARGWTVQQVDVTVVAEFPKIAPYRAAMRIRIAEALGVMPDSVSIKGKTNEGMGWIGRREGLACLAVATVVSLPDSLR
jgi:2-C-methyl-D-erythritol 2,4-cyclodiphosphate synthase